MSAASDKFDHWIRTSFVQMNTALERLYAKLDDPQSVMGVGDDIKADLLAEGQALVSPLAAEGNTEKQFDNAFDVLGNLGFFLGALRRHELTNPEREITSPYGECSALGMHIAASIGVVPRFATAHLTTHNRTRAGVAKSFTSLPDEKIFNDYNTFGILSFKRAGAALMRIPAMGVAAPAVPHLLEEARVALVDVAKYNKQLFETLDPQQFFFHIRPYYKPYRVGRQIYRGANAGDFAEINQIDLLLGLCRGNDPYYAQLLEEKILYMMPDDQKGLRKSLGMKPLLDDLLELAPKHQNSAWFQQHLSAYLQVCEAHGRTAAQHHNILVKRFIRQPSADIDASHLGQITASGPALDSLLADLQRLRDLRMAAARDDMKTAHDQLAYLRGLLSTGQ